MEVTTTSVHSSNQVQLYGILSHRSLIMLDASGITSRGEIEKNHNVLLMGSSTENFSYKDSTVQVSGTRAYT